MNRWKISAEIETTRKSQMKMLEVKKKDSSTKKVVSAMKNSFNELIDLTKLSKGSVNL